MTYIVIVIAAVALNSIQMSVGNGKKATFFSVIVGTVMGIIGSMVHGALGLTATSAKNAVKVPVQAFNEAKRTKGTVDAAAKSTAKATKALFEEDTEDDDSSWDNLDGSTMMKWWTTFNDGDEPRA